MSSSEFTQVHGTELRSTPGASRLDRAGLSPADEEDIRPPFD